MLRSSSVADGWHLQPVSVRRVEHDMFRMMHFPEVFPPRWRISWTALMLMYFCCLCATLVSVDAQKAPIEDIVGYNRPEHALNHELFSELKACDANGTYCMESGQKITLLAAKIANEHAALLLHDRALDIFEDVLYFLQSEHTIGKRTAHILSVLSFSQGRTVQVTSRIVLAVVYSMVSSLICYILVCSSLRTG